MRRQRSFEDFSKNKNVYRFFVPQEFVSPSFCPKDEVSQTHRGRGLDATKVSGWELGSFSVGLSHWFLIRNTSASRKIQLCCGFRVSEFHFLTRPPSFPTCYCQGRIICGRTLEQWCQHFQRLKRIKGEKNFIFQNLHPWNHPWIFETPTRKSLDSNLRKWKTEGSNVWPWRLFKSFCLEYQFLLIWYSSSPWDSSNGSWFGILLVASTKNIYQRRIKPWDICFGRWIYTFSSVNSCWVNNQPSGASRLHHILCPKFAGMDETWHPKCSRTHVGKGSPVNIRPEDLTPLKFSSLQLSLVALEVAHFTHLRSGNQATKTPANFRPSSPTISEKSLAPHRHFSKMIMESYNIHKSSHLRVIGY